MLSSGPVHGGTETREVGRATRPATLPITSHQNSGSRLHSVYCTELGRDRGDSLPRALEETCTLILRITRP